LAIQLLRRRRVAILNDSLLFLGLAMVVWVALIRPWSQDWQHGLSDIRDWIIPVLAYVALVSTIRDGWRRWTLLLLFVVLAQALFGIYQHVTDSARPFISQGAEFKTGFAISPETSQLALVSFAVGTFSHPNNFALYLFVGLMVLLGWRTTSWWRLLKPVLLVAIVLALFWAYAKASLVVMAVAIVIFWVQRWFRSGRVLLLATGIGLLLLVVGLLIAARLIPAVLLGTLYWRFGLWEAAIRVMGEYPAILLVGNGIESFAQQAYYGQPHNTYLFMLLEYGMFGPLWLLAVMCVIGIRGWRARSHAWLRREPLLSALWIALFGYFAVGLVETNLLDIESRMIFFLVIACFTGLARELRAETRRAVPPPEQPYVSTALTYPGSV
ncbi:MAG TPA: hypothetical protein VFX76_08220, partial [Roseiflexaceae bacterium]|nr:hypothetical protein [Roseiflexaceae bacterium]